MRFEFFYKKAQFAILITLIIFGFGCASGGSDSSNNPPSPPAPPLVAPDPPTNLQAKLEVRASSSDEHTDVHVTWDPVASSVDYYEILWSYPSPLPGARDISGTVLVPPQGPFSAWISKGPELVPMEIKGRAVRSNIRSALTASSSVLPGPTAPLLSATFEGEGNPLRAITLKINRQSQMADQVSIFRAEGSSPSRDDWKQIVNISYDNNATLTFTDKDIIETRHYSYKIINSKDSIFGDPTFVKDVWTYLFNPTDFTAAVSSSEVSLSWKSWSQAATNVELFRCDSNGLGFIPYVPGNRKLISGDTNLSSWTDVPYQPGFFTYYFNTSSSTTNRYSNFLHFRYMGLQELPAFKETRLDTSFPRGIPGGAPSGPWFWFLFIDNQLQIYSQDHGNWKTTIFPSTTAMIRPGVRINSKGQPYFFYRKPLNGQDPSMPGLQNLIYAYLENDFWNQQVVFQWEESSLTNVWMNRYQSIGLDGSIVLTKEIPSNFENSIQYTYEENNIWHSSSYTFSFTPYSIHNPLPLQVDIDGTWIQPFEGYNEVILFQSNDKGNSWTRSSIPIDGNGAFIALGMNKKIYCFSTIYRGSPLYSEKEITDWELVCRESSGGNTGPSKHVLYYNHTGSILHMRTSLNPTTGQLALLADPSTGLTLALQDAAGAWMLLPTLPGEWRMEDRLDTCLLSWVGGDLMLLADAEWGFNSVSYQMTVVNGPGISPANEFKSSKPLNLSGHLREE